ncbi:M1 family metallopeptidase [Glaciihabitans sp. dw_435]|uniref:M1 family metallopeptidase n=1 Tax=Glaciihabitans sp. dw_435 TaxID=2720081 RepID=UPI001BD459B4|nr:M1 family metallopeptidase [Glaciihabitans sp. dw_435]
MSQNPNATYGSASAGDPYLPAAGNDGYSVEFYDLELDYRVATNRLSAIATITARATMPLDRFSLDLAGLTVEKVLIDGVRVQKHTHSARKLVITAAHTIEAGEQFEVEVRYRGAPHPVRSPWGDVGWEELTDGVLVASQPSGASSWFPCNDHPSNKAGFRIAVSCEAPYTVVANGSLVSRMTRAGRTSWVYESPEPMATYLATVQIGRYKATAVASAPVPHQVFHPADLANHVAVDFGRLGDMLALFEKLFGPYPFSSYVVVVTDDELEIPLESQALATFGRNHVDGLHGSDRLIAHELAHQWFGNSLTVALWKDIWLHEGFACYAEWLWSEGSGGKSAHENAIAAARRLEGLPKEIVIGDPGAADMFDDRVYKRGALALHAIRLHLGDERFFGLLRTYVDDRKFENVSAEIFVEFSCAYSGDRAPERLVQDWVYSTALPTLVGQPTP